MMAIVNLSAVVIDCADAAATAGFYRAACGGNITRS
jgi:hypothetical protein